MANSPPHLLRLTSLHPSIPRHLHVPFRHRTRCSSSTASTTTTTTTTNPSNPPTQPYHISQTHISSLRASLPRLWASIHHTAQWGAANPYPHGPNALASTHDTDPRTATGLSRLALSETDKVARDWFVGELKGLGCEVFVDRIGNIFGVRRGRASARSKKEGKGGMTPPAVFAGSHLDSQPSGGRYDGVLGVCAALEMLRTFDDGGIETEGDVGVVNWTNEEGARWGVSMMGSGVWAGARGLEEVWGLRDQLGGVGRGRRVREELEGIGYLGGCGVGLGVGEEGKGRVLMAGHFEVHIEQGRRLEGMGRRVGVVKGVQGYRWFEVVVKGREAHAGTTLFEDRADPLVVAAGVVREVRKIAVSAGGLGTVGTLELKGGSINTIPGEVKFTVDLRHEDDQVVESMVASLKRSAEATVERDAGVNVEFKEVFDSKSVMFDEMAKECVRLSAEAIGEADPPSLMSGAGHDSVNTQTHCPTAMIFVPCRKGISHHPEEYSTPEACQDGASVLLQSVLRFDRLRHERGDFA